MLLDPMLPEKQRARRRLVGAIVLVLAAILILPLVLDSHPKPSTSDIAIDIPGHAASAASSAPASQASAGIASNLAPVGASGPAGAAASGVPAQTQTQTQTATPTVAVATPTAAPARNAQNARAASSVALPASPSSDDTDTPAATAPGVHFAVQLGAFASDDDARRWVARLKAVGVPAYVEHRAQGEGAARALLRAGPFASREAAIAAIAKVRGAGLMAGAREAGH